MLCCPTCRLGGDGEVNELIGAAFRQVPSFKFLPLVYQVASRMSAGKRGRQAQNHTTEGRSGRGLLCHQHAKQVQLSLTGSN